MIDPNDGSPTDAFLAPETRKYLQSLLEKDHVSIDDDAATSLADTSLADSDSVSSDGDTNSVEEATDVLREVEIPLYSDIEFFDILQEELSSLHSLQQKEQTDLNNQVGFLRQDIIKATSSSLGRYRSAFYAWREIFRVYMDAEVFISTGEVDSGERTSTKAHQQLERFQTALSQENHTKKLNKESRAALRSFTQINLALLQNMKFQEINRVALRKILKKFDKRTALQAQDVFPLFEPLVAQNIARMVCQTICQEVLSVVPQLSDYLCPICFNIAFKPVRLRCNHVFCIRCLVIMQRAQQNHCALCRAEVVLEATIGKTSKSIVVETQDTNIE